jgi:hypothetical protein
MPVDVLLFELLMLGLFGWVLLDARRAGRWRIIEVLVSCLYGLALEWVTLQQLAVYSYGEFLLMLDGAPLAIGMGWAVILYAAMEFSDRLSMPDRLRPLADGLFALNIDLAMDTIAIRQEFWTWGIVGLDEDWFGVPWGNFWAWFIVVSAFSAFIRWFRRQGWREGGRQWLYPLLALGLSLAVLLPTNVLMKSVLRALGWDFAGMAILIGSGLAIVVATRPRFLPGRPTSAVVSAVPLAFHGYFLVTGMLFGIFLDAPLLGVMALLMALISVIMHWQLRRVCAKTETVQLGHTTGLPHATTNGE